MNFRFRFQFETDIAAMKAKLQHWKTNDELMNIDGIEMTIDLI